MVRCIAMDDEPLALEQLKSYILKVPYLQLVAACPDAYEAMKIINEEKIDAVFADINMPDLNGLDFIRSLKEPPLVVFTTAYSDYAIEGYKVDAIDYILKPFGLDEFLAAADKVRKQHELLTKNTTDTETKEFSPFLYIKTDHKMVRIDASEIRYVEGMSEYVRIYTDDSVKPVVTLLSMKKLEETLSDEMFMRVHKSYIVNMSKILSVTKTSIQMDKNTYIPVGDSYRERFIQYINARALGK